MDSTAASLPTLVDNVALLLRRRVEQTPDLPAYRYLVAHAWQEVSWRQVAAEVDKIAAGLLELGLAKGERVAIVSGTRYEWILTDLAILAAGGATTTVYPTTNADDAVHILADAGCVVAVVEDAAQLATVLEHRAQLPALRHIVVIDAGTDRPADVLSLADLRQTGAAALGGDPALVTRATDAVGPDDLATLIYTSGTTGRPKGVRLTHRAWVYEGEALKAMGFLRQDDVHFLWLPMAHSFGKVILSTQLAVGFVSAIDGRIDKIIDNLAVVRPTFMGAAPRIFEKAHARIVTTQEAAGGVKKFLFTQAFAVGLEVAALRRSGRKVPTALGVKHRLLDKLVLHKVRERFGGRVRFFISGSAPLNREIAEWFGAAGILIVEGYGLTETTAGAACGHPDRNRFGTVGAPLPGSLIRIGDDGEVQVSGPHLMDGYHNLPAETADAFTDDGWLRTGDQGSLDIDGLLTITGRLKDLLKTSGGKTVAPAGVEATLKALCPFVSQALVFGDGRPYCVALLTLDPDAIGVWAADQGLGQSADLLETPQVQELIGGYIGTLNERLNPWETVKRWSILPEDLTIEAGDLTPSMKVRRAQVQHRHHERIEALYD